MQREFKKGDLIRYIEADIDLKFIEYKSNGRIKAEVIKDYGFFNKGEVLYWLENKDVELINKGSDRNKENYLKGEHPDYYTGKHKGIKAIDVIHDFELSHCKASALEYILRSGKKDDEIQDLSKAINHLEMYIKHLKEINTI